MLQRTMNYKTSFERVSVEIGAKCKRCPLNIGRHLQRVIFHVSFRFRKILKLNSFEFEYMN